MFCDIRSGNKGKVLGWEADRFRMSRNQSCHRHPGSTGISLAESCLILQSTLGTMGIRRQAYIMIIATDMVAVSAESRAACRLILATKSYSETLPKFSLSGLREVCHKGLYSFIIPEVTASQQDLVNDNPQLKAQQQVHFSTQ